MARLYQPTKNNPYRLRDSIYWQVVHDIKDARKYIDGYYDEDYMKPYAPNEATVNAVAQAVKEEPEETRAMIFDAVSIDKALPEGYRNKATTLQKAHFIYRCAELLGYELGAKKIVTVTYDWR